MTIEQEIFAVLTDTFHKPGFKLHVLVLQHLFCLVACLTMVPFFFSPSNLGAVTSLNNTMICFQVETGLLSEPLWDVATVTYPYPNNGFFVREYTIKLLSTSFPNMTASEV